ncbi:MAG: hypothetical protein IT581_03030 [Verrucomicrobiales bacterium]|nr:hypothetical protein [Verrucomicrobiales bacterium]
MSPKLFIIIAGPLWVPLLAPAGPAKYLPIDGPPPLRFRSATKSIAPPAALPPLTLPVARPMPESEPPAAGPEPATTEDVVATLPSPAPVSETNALPVEVRSGDPGLSAAPTAPTAPTISPQALIPFFTVPVVRPAAAGATAVVAAPVTFVPPQLSNRGGSQATYTKSP